MTWDADTFTELVMEPDSIPDLLVRLLVAVTIQSSTQTSISFESQEDRAHLIIKHHGHGRTLTATEASRQFSTLLDSIEAGDIVVVTRGNRPIAEIRPVTRRTEQPWRRFRLRTRSSSQMSPGP